MNASEPGAIAQHVLVLFDGARLLEPGGLLLAEMGEDGRWYTSEGLPCSALHYPVPRLEPVVAPQSHGLTEREQVPSAPRAPRPPRLFGARCAAAG